MASKLSGSSAASSAHEKSEDTHLQECFVLRRVSPSGNTLADTASSARSPRAKRKVDFEDKSSLSEARTCQTLPPEILEDESPLHRRRRMDAFSSVWSQIEKTTQEVLRDLNNSTFEEIHQWIDGFRQDSNANAYPSFPVVKQLPTALVFMRNVEFVDDSNTFHELCLYLKSYKCHVANLQPNEFSTKMGLGGCVRSLLRQLTMISPETPDMEILASWYHEPGNWKNSVVIIIEDVERCNNTVLSEFVKLLSEWIVRIPVILVMGMATTIDALKKMLPSDAIQHLCAQRFNLKYSFERLEAVITAISMKTFIGFYIGNEVLKFLYKFFLRQDGTLTSFLRALKMACMEHFFGEPLSFLCIELTKDARQEDLEHLCGALPNSMLKYAAELPSAQLLQRTSEDNEIATKLSSGLLEIQKARKKWSLVLSYLREVGKHTPIQLIDLLCDVPCQNVEHDKSLGNSSSSNGSLHNNQYGDTGNHKVMTQILRKIRDFSPASLATLLKDWEKLTEEMPELTHEIQTLQSFLEVHINNNNGEVSHTDILDNFRNRASAYKNIALGKGNPKTANDKVARLLQQLVRQYFRPLGLMPFHEIVCYNQVDTLKSALLGDTRKTIQRDLMNFQNVLQCDCCRNKVGVYSSMHDTSLVYNLAQEHGDVVNVHDCYQSFRTIISETEQTKGGTEKTKLKKQRSANGQSQTDRAMIQARFCKAITELQIAGLFRMPTKRRPDYLQRVAFGS